jgi:hypothetical protein
MQTFSSLIVSRIQSINLNKDGRTVKGISDLKNKIKINTFLDETFELWKEILERHLTSAPYKSKYNGKV